MLAERWEVLRLGPLTSRKCASSHPPPSCSGLMLASVMRRSRPTSPVPTSSPDSVDLSLPDPLGLSRDEPAVRSSRVCRSASPLSRDSPPSANDSLSPPAESDSHSTAKRRRDGAAEDAGSEPLPGRRSSRPGSRSDDQPPVFTPDPVADPLRPSRALLGRVHRNGQQYLTKCAERGRDCLALPSAGDSTSVASTSSASKPVNFAVAQKRPRLPARAGSLPDNLFVWRPSPNRSSTLEIETIPTRLRHSSLVLSSRASPNRRVMHGSRRPRHLRRLPRPAVRQRPQRFIYHLGERRHVSHGGSPGLLGTFADDSRGATLTNFRAPPFTFSRPAAFAASFASGHVGSRNPVRSFDARA